MGDETGNHIGNMIHASDLFKSSKVEQKRANCELKDKKLVYSIRKPFNILMELNGCQSWLGQLIPSAPLRLRGNRDDLTAQGLVKSTCFRTRRCSSHD